MNRSPYFVRTPFDFDVVCGPSPTRTGHKPDEKPVTSGDSAVPKASGPEPAASQS